MQKQSEADSLDLRDYVRPIWDRRWLIVAIVVIATVATYFYYAAKPEEYTAYSKLFLETSELDRALAGVDAAASPDPERTATNMASIVESPVVAKEAARNMGFGGDPRSLLGQIDATSTQGSDFLDISAVAGDPREAAQLANAFAVGFIRNRSAAGHAKVGKAIKATEEQIGRLTGSSVTSTARSQLEARLRRLQAIQALPAANAQQIARAQPPGVPSYPTPRKNAVFAFALSLLFALGVAYLLERLDRRLKRLEDVESTFGIPMLTAIAHETALGSHGEVSWHSREAFRSLRTNVQLASPDRPIRLLLVTSALAGEGKSLVVRNLALAYREAGQRVAVVEADLRRPVLARLFEVEARPGLTDVVAGEHDLHSALQPISASVLHSGQATTEVETEVAPIATSLNGGGDGSLVVLTSGPQPPNPPQLLAADRVRNLFGELAADYDLVLIDSPPLLSVSDAIPLVSSADGIVLVSRLGVSTQDSARRCIDVLSRVPGANVLGVVANDVPKSELTGGYGYYGYYGSESSG
jgi:polysaccharide biosynthesis transport protein